jgi:outer membrane protein
MINGTRKQKIYLSIITLFILITTPVILYADSDKKEGKEYSKAGALNISIQEAILIALENNRAFRIERLNPEIMKTYEAEQEAQFDPVLSVDSSLSKSTLASGIADLTKIERKQNTGEISKRFSTGTEIAAGVATEDLASSRPGSERIRSAQGNISITQSLLQGFGRTVNLANLNRARAASRVSEYELRGFAESLVAEVEKTCWDYILRQRRINIFMDSLKLAEDQLAETQKRIDIGKLAKVELYAAQAEVALRREALINARSDLSLTGLKLRRLLNYSNDDSTEREITILDKPVVTEVQLDETINHVQVALKQRPEINQTRLEIERGELETVRTKNGLLPLLDFFITFGKTGYADSFGNAFRNINDNKYDIAAGIAFEFPLKNRADKARHKRAILSKQQMEESLTNLEQLVEVDVRSSLIEINRAGEQVTATEATRKFQEESLRAETEKFRVGKSTALLVARAQRDFLVGQLAEIEAVITYLKAIIDFYQSEGTLLERSGISVLGG